MAATYTQFSRDRSRLGGGPALMASHGQSGLRLTPTTCGKVWETREVLEPGHPVYRIALGILSDRAKSPDDPHRDFARELLSHVLVTDPTHLDALEREWWHTFRGKSLSAFPELHWDAQTRLIRAGVDTVGKLLAHTPSTLRELPGIGDATVIAVNRAYAQSYLPRHHQVGLAAVLS